MSIELINLKVSPQCANRSRANAKADANRPESKLRISASVTSDLFEENKEVKEQSDEMSSKAELLETELLEADKTNILLMQKSDEYHIAKRIPKIIWTKDTQMKDPSEIEKTRQTTTNKATVNCHRTCRSNSTDSSCRRKAMQKI